jgi:hypothetical protein
MKNIKNIFKLSLLTVAVFAISSCSDFLDVNDDPNRVTEKNVTAELIFPQTQTAVGSRQAIRYVFLNNWMGYWARSGNFIVEQEETTYKVTNTFTETNWDNAYNILFDLHQVKTKALAGNDKFLAGASMVLSVKLWQEVVDMYGAVPYTQAFDYEKYPRPAYDAANAIYADLLVKLDQALSYLSESPKSTFAKADLIYCRADEDMLAGAPAYWKKLANTIRLRILLRQSASIANATVTAQMAIINANGGLLGAGEDVNVNPGYVNETDKQSPFYANFGLTPAGSAASTNNKANNYFVKVVLKATDPRLVRYYKAPVTGTDYGAPNGNVADPQTQIVGSDLGPGLAGSSTQDAWILPAFESMFFQAEAIARGWIAGGDAAAQAMYENAVKANFTFLGLTDVGAKFTAYQGTDASSVWSSNADKVKLIAWQKYKALCGIDPLESWSDLRRLGGGLTIAPDANTGYLSNNPVRATHLPYVMPYPQTEITTNSASMPARTDIFTEKIFWQP